MPSSWMLPSAGTGARPLQASSAKPPAAVRRHASHAISPEREELSQPSPAPPTAANRRALLLAAGAAAIAVPALAQPPAHAESPPTSNPRVYFDVSIDRRPAGRIVVEVDRPLAPVGAQRFLDLAQGKEGVGYRRSKVELIQDGFVQDSGLKALSYKASGQTSIAGGPTAELLEDELAASTRRHDAAGLVSLVVLNSEELAQKERLVAIRGKLVSVTEVLGEMPNGTAFAITTRPEPSLDGINLIVGRVVEGMEVVAELAGLRRVQDNSGSPFFQAGKAVGDKRAIVAERGFGRPFARIVIEQSGLL